MPDTPLNKDALKWLSYIEDAIKSAGYNCNCASTPDSVSIDKDWLDHHLHELKKSLLAVVQPVTQKLTDEEWRAFQAIPDQGYSHRAWIDARIAERLTVAQPVVNSFDPRELNRRGWTCGCEPGNYDDCWECQSACNELEQFLNRLNRPVEG